MSERDPNMPSAFRPGSIEESMWKVMYGNQPPLPPMTDEEKARLDAAVDRWVQEGKDRNMVEIITRLR